MADNQDQGDKLSWDSDKGFFNNLADWAHKINSVRDPDVMSTNAYEFYRNHGYDHDAAMSHADSLTDRLQQKMNRTGHMANAATYLNPFTGPARVMGDVVSAEGDPAKLLSSTPVGALSELGAAAVQKGYEKARGALGYASGGDVDKALQAVGGQQGNPVETAQQTISAPRPRFAIRPAGTAPAAPTSAPAYQFSQLEEGRANTNSLRDAFRRGIERHLSLPEGERIVNSRNAIKALEPYMGVRKDGKPIALLSQNAKLLKAQTGTDEKKPIELEDGRGVETIGLSLYPDYREGEMKLCPNSASCRDECLGKTSGQYSEAFSGSQEKKGGISVRQRAMNRTQAMMREPEAFAVRLWDDIESARREAERNGNHLGVRLNTLSDLNPIIHEPIIKGQPDVSFYDYTKMGWSPVAENHHYTHSSTGLTQDEVHNPHTNWNKMRRKLDQGENVAMVFTNKGKQLPDFVHDQESGKKYRVIDGRTHDFRPLDMLENDGTEGQIVGLSNLKSTGQRDQAHIDSNGFFVKYDPKVHGDTLPIVSQKKVRG